jgi:hypothetical protein
MLELDSVSYRFLAHTNYEEHHLVAILALKSFRYFLLANRSACSLMHHIYFYHLLCFDSCFLSNISGERT